MTERVRPQPSISRGGMAERLYGALPAIVRRLDEPTPELAGRGQLRGLLEVLASTLDLTMVRAEALEDRHDLDRMPSERLPDLAGWIGWPLDPDEPTQWREELRLAPEVYRTLGTERGLTALVRRATGWRVQWKRMADRTLLTNAPERSRGAHSGPTVISSTLDTRDQHALAGLGTLADRAHYTYEKGRYDAVTVEGWLFVGDTAPALVSQRLAQLDPFLASFKPLHVTIRWVIVHEEAAFSELFPLGERLRIEDPELPEIEP